MARPIAQDFLHSMRFHVTADDEIGGQNPLKSADTFTAGFSYCSTPKASVAVAQYREGHYVYTRKQPGIPEMEDVTLSRGVTKTDSEFWNWLRVVIEGNGEYRSTITIKHFPREALPATGFGAQQKDNSNQKLNLAYTPPRIYRLFQAFPNSHKVATDLDSNSTEIAIMEMGIAYESFEIFDAA